MANRSRPVWTSCFVLVWMLVVPGAVLTHLALVNLLPYLQDMPKNIAKGFDETLKFAYLEDDSQSVRSSAAAALQKCGVVANINCKNGSYPATTQLMQQTSNTTDEQSSIVASFKNSLDIVSMIANDKYFGISDLKPTAQSLNKIVDDLKELNGTMECYKSNPLFCNIYTSAGQITAGMSSVNKALDTFKTSDVVEAWDNYQHLLILLHGLPYIMVIALLFFTCFWMKGGVCCCCKGGTIMSLCLIPYAVFWLASFAVYFTVCIIGVGIKYGAALFRIPVLQGKPTLEKAIAHIEASYPEFWKLVFGDLTQGCELLLRASFFFVGASIIIALYSLSECCFCPYRKASEGRKPKASKQVGGVQQGILV